MSFIQHRTLSRRGFCLCCAAAGLTATHGWLGPSQAYAEARSIVDLIRDEAVKAPIKSTNCAATLASSKALAATSRS